jgi:hypothetical protein
MLSVKELFEGEDGQEAIQAMTALCRSFDEMRILINFLFENQSQAKNL